ncbi:hypothetical protein BgiBS90_032763, partial [Biomphalaria glabrata]
DLMMKNKAPPDISAAPAPTSEPVIIYDLKQPPESSSSGSSKDSSGDMFLPIEFRCEACGKRAFNLKTCSRCWGAKYCDNICQTRHWDKHSQVCVEDPKGRQFLKGGHILELDMMTPLEQQGTYLDSHPSSLGTMKCPKHGHNNHSAFIAIHDFNKSHLPLKLRMDEVVNYILAEAQFTVRVMVYWTSKQRPDDDVCARFRGTQNPRAASGKVLLSNPKDIKVRRCPVAHCHRHRDLGPDHTVYVVDVKVSTNGRVIFDEEELRRTTVDFFYDSGNGVGLVREYGYQLFPSRSTSDVRYFSIGVHDLKLLQRLERADGCRSACFKSIPHEALRAMSAHAIVISHPHGTQKKITVGNVVRITEENLTPDSQANAKMLSEMEKMWFETRSQLAHSQMIAAMGQLSLPVYKVWYDAATCLGSAGAPVYFGARQTSGIWGPYEAQHASYDIDAKLNYFKVPRFVA